MIKGCSWHNNDGHYDELAVMASDMVGVEIFVAYTDSYEILQK